MTKHNNGSVNILNSLLRDPYVWPGAYARVAITDDGGTLCQKCVRDERERIQESTPKDGFHLNGWFINWEDPLLYCDHCGDRIPSEYSEEEKEKDKDLDDREQSDGPMSELPRAPSGDNTGTLGSAAIRLGGNGQTDRADM